jgi:hypothetical protein
VKKILLLILFVLFLAAGFIFFGPSKKTAESKTAADKTGAISGRAPSSVGRISADKVDKISKPVQSTLASSDVMAAVRAAVANGDRAGYEDAFKGLVDYINAHPDRVDEYVALLKTEQNEHVLRTFALAIAETEVGLRTSGKRPDYQCGHGIGERFLIRATTAHCVESDVEVSRHAR